MKLYRILRLMIRNVTFVIFRVSSSKCLTFCLALTFLMIFYLCILTKEPGTDRLSRSAKFKISPKILNKKHLAVIVPFRDRFEELLEFVPHMYDFLNRQNIPFHIFIVQQADSYRFNRASLINVGFLHTRNDYDYIAMHDVDLLPLNDDLKYNFPANGPLHISSPETHPKYHYATFVGGILLIKREHFVLVKGFSNNYWGWGLEDDEFYIRMKDAGLTVRRPENITTGTKNTFKHVHDKTYRRRDMRQCHNQREVTRKRDRITGLHDVAYKLKGEHSVVIDDLPITVLNVELICNKNTTPWCQCPEPTKAVKKTK